MFNTINPPGKWVMFPSMILGFVNDEIGAVYGIVYPKVYDSNSGTPNAGKVMWYWEARTVLNTRNEGILPCGWVYTEKDAQRIVETILYATKTVRGPE